MRVALRKESVDRNGEIKLNANLFVLSLSARRAWIEIAASGCAPSASGVALRKESVDRNASYLTIVLGYLPVALRKESVDRNNTTRVGVSGTLKSLSARRAWNVSLSDCSGWFCSCGYPL